MRHFPRVALVLLAACAAVSPTEAWKNPRKSSSLIKPVFGTHDYIAYQGYILAGRPSWVRNNLNLYFIGTEAPDNGFGPDDAEGTYADAIRCHCILFDEDGDVTNDRAELRVREEYDKTVAALNEGDRALAAFYAGAMVHYIGDLAQFMHLMGSKSHWGSENQTLHSAYEVSVENTINFKNRTSSLLDAYIEEVNVSGSTPETIARAAARYTERGNSGRTAGWMYTHWRGLSKAKKRPVSEWDKPFTDQTGQNVNFSANAIAKLLKMIEDEE